MEKKKKISDYYLSLTDIPAAIKDGVSVTLAANIGNPHDIDSAVKYGCDGVGLFRTEFVFMGSDAFSAEEEQFEAYPSFRQVSEKTPKNRPFTTIKPAEQAGFIVVKPTCSALIYSTYILYSQICYMMA